VTSSRVLVAVLLAGAAVGAIGRSVNGSDVARVAGMFAAAALGAVAVGVVRKRTWASGAAFFIGLCWLWAIIALRVQGVLEAPEIALWIAWSIVVMVVSVRTRPG
jgi:hypothetical protein